MCCADLLVGNVDFIASVVLEIGEKENRFL